MAWRGVNASGGFVRESREWQLGESCHASSECRRTPSTTFPSYPKEVTRSPPLEVSVFDLVFRPHTPARDELRTFEDLTLL